MRPGCHLRAGRYGGQGSQGHAARHVHPAGGAPDNLESVSDPIDQRLRLSARDDERDVDQGSGQACQRVMDDEPRVNPPDHPDCRNARRDCRSDHRDPVQDVLIAVSIALRASFLGAHHHEGPPFVAAVFGLSNPPYQKHFFAT